jgi:hypothetical protein
MSPRLDHLLQKQRQKSTSRVSDPIVAPIVAITAPMKTNAAGAARGGRRLYGKRSPANGIFRERQRGFVGPASSDHDDRLLKDAESYDLHALGASGADAASIEIPIDLDVCRGPSWLENIELSAKKAIKRENIDPKYSHV